MPPSHCMEEAASINRLSRGSNHVAVCHSSRGAPSGSVLKSQTWTLRWECCFSTAIPHVSSSVLLTTCQNGVSLGNRKGLVYGDRGQGSGGYMSSWGMWELMWLFSFCHIWKELWGTGAGSVEFLVHVMRMYLCPVQVLWTGPSMVNS